MVDLYGTRRTARELAALSGSSTQFFGVRLMSLGDGVERGIRLLEFRSGTGLRFTVLVDRAMDIADCEYKGLAIGWHSPSGFRHPGLHEYEGEAGLAWLRSFSGLLLTCGLDHILSMDEAPADQYVYEHRKSMRHSIHGRVSTIPARLTGYGESWDGDECTLWCEGVATQAAVFAEHLELTRRIEVKVGSNEITLKDRVVNRGFYPTPHMLCYHINLGHPVVDEGAQYLAPIVESVWASHAGERYRAQEVGYRTLSGPREGFHEQVWQHEMKADEDGLVPVAVVNRRLGVGFAVVTRKEEFPCMFEWQNLQAGQYAIGVEPATNHVLGAKFARERGEVVTLRHGDYREYGSTFAVLNGRNDIGRMEKRIRSICGQSEGEYPPLSNRFAALR